MKKIIIITFCLIMLGGGLSSCRKRPELYHGNGVYIHFIGWSSYTYFTIVKVMRDNHSVPIDTVLEGSIKSSAFPHYLDFEQFQRNDDYLIYVDSSDQVNVISDIKIIEPGESSYLFNGERRTDWELKIYK